MLECLLTIGTVSHPQLKIERNIVNFCQHLILALKLNRESYSWVWRTLIWVVGILYVTVSAMLGVALFAKEDRFSRLANGGFLHPFRPGMIQETRIICTGQDAFEPIIEAVDEVTSVHPVQLVIGTE